MWYLIDSTILMGRVSLSCISPNIYQRRSPSAVHGGSFLSDLQHIQAPRILCYGIQEDVSLQGLSICFLCWLRINNILACVLPIFLICRSVLIQAFFILLPSVFYLCLPDLGRSLPTHSLLVQEAVLPCWSAYIAACYTI